MTGGKHWWSGKVCWNKTYHDGDKPGTRIDVYRYIGIRADQEEGVWKFLVKQVGREYDWAGIWGILRRKVTQNPLKWFCSEMEFTAYLKNAMALLVNILPSQVTPRLWSPRRCLSTLAF